MSSSSKKRRRIARFQYEPTLGVELVGTGRGAYLWIGGLDPGHSEYFGSIGSRRVIQLLKRAGLINPEDVSK